MKVYCHKCKKYDWCHNTIHNNDNYNCGQYQEEKILFLIVTKKWYNESAAGRKMVDYREDTPYWRKRLAEIRPTGQHNLRKDYDKVILQLGYSKRYPRLEFKFKHIEYVDRPEYVKDTIKTKCCFAIYFEQLKENTKCQKKSLRQGR